MAPGVVPPAILLPSVVLNSAFAPRLQVSQKRLKRHSSYCMEPFPRMRPNDMGKSDFMSSGEVRGDAGFASSLPDK